MKKKILCVLLIAVLLAVGSLNWSKVHVARALQINLWAGTVLEDEDNHGGFHGDGSRWMVVKFKKDISEQLAEKDNWKELPLTQNLETAAHDFALFPDDLEVSEGYYYFRDRHSQSTDPTDDSQLLGRTSYNFDLAIYDSQTQTLYYSETDT